MSAAAPAPAAAAAPAVVAPATATANIGSGGYGFVVSPAIPNIVDGETRNYPENVTKIFFNERKYTRALARAAKVPEVMGVNEGHRINPYRRELKGSLLSEAVRTARGIDPDATLYGFRMPNLGKDIAHMDSYIPALRKVPILTIIQQIVKLLGQVNRLFETQYVHGDIRETNVMVKPDGTLTIIDFDLLLPKRSFFHDFASVLGFYSHPPEAILFPMVQHRLRDFKLVESWVNRNVRHYPNYYSALGVSPRDMYNFIKSSVLVQASDTMGSGVYPDTETAREGMLFPHFDSFGLAHVLLEFLTKLYGRSIVQRPATRGGVTILLAEMRALGLKNGGRDYTDIEFVVTNVCLSSLVHYVLLPLADLDPQERIRRGMIHTVYPVARSYLARLTADLDALASGAAVGAPAPAPAPAMVAPATASAAPFEAIVAPAPEAAAAAVARARARAAARAEAEAAATGAVAGIAGVPAPAVAAPAPAPAPAPAVAAFGGAGTGPAPAYPVYNRYAGEVPLSGEPSNGSYTGSYGSSRRSRRMRSTRRMRRTRRS